jgi:hypothetical protein
MKQYVESRLAALARQRVVTLAQLNQLDGAIAAFEQMKQEAEKETTVEPASTNNGRVVEATAFTDD